jgi:hypothetical protein
MEESGTEPAIEDTISHMFRVWRAGQGFERKKDRKTFEARKLQVWITLKIDGAELKRRLKSFAFKFSSRYDAQKIIGTDDSSMKTSDEDFSLSVSDLIYILLQKLKQVTSSLHFHFTTQFFDHNVP